jgi:hypothetical protein
MKTAESGNEHEKARRREAACERLSWLFIASKYMISPSKVDEQGLLAVAETQQAFLTCSSKFPPLSKDDA